jgi:hypothetical protein
MVANSMRLKPRQDDSDQAENKTRIAARPTHDELLHFFNDSPDLLCIAGFDGIFRHLNPA